MANHQSAIKRIRQIETRSEINRANRSAMRTQVKKLTKAIEAGEVDEAKKLLSPTISFIDKSVRKGVIRKGTADRMKSRLTMRLNKTAQ
ncbi:MAG: 30S ribosomal protein S20 [Bryobacterales bacterium]